MKMAKTLLTSFEASATYYFVSITGWDILPKKSLIITWVNGPRDAGTTITVFHGKNLEFLTTDIYHSFLDEGVGEADAKNLAEGISKVLAMEPNLYF